MVDCRPSIGQPDVIRHVGARRTAAGRGEEDDSLRFFFVTYCFGHQPEPPHEGGQVLIGVYKRGLRVALELCDRGHEVYFLCEGRHNFHDAMTAEAEERMTFVDWDLEEATPEATAASRGHFLAGMRRIAPDVVVIGEAPLAGVMLECTLAAAVLNTPAVCLDNAYGRDQSKLFCDNHGPIFDGVILTGPSSFHTLEPPPYLLQVPPYMKTSPDGARALLAELGLGDGDRQVTVLAYDHNVEALGVSLIGKLDDPRLDAVFITHRVDDCQARLASLPAAVRRRTRVIPPQEDRLLFGLLQIADLAVGKCAFMQVTECLSLLTPIVGFYFEGDFHLRCIPEVCHDFAHSSADATADAETVTTVRRYLELRPEDMLSVHDGSLEAATRAAEFLEQVAGWPRRDTTGETRVHHGLEAAYLEHALAAGNGSTVGIQQVRATRIRNSLDQQIYALVCHYRADGRDAVDRLWWRRFPSSEGTLEEAGRVREPGSGRQLYVVDPERRWLFEADAGQDRLPEVDDV